MGNFNCKSALVRKGLASSNSHTAKMADETTEETQFVVDEVSNIIKESIESNRRQQLRAQQGQSVDEQRRRVVPRLAHQAPKTFQIYCDVCDHAEERSGAAHGELVL